MRSVRVVLVAGALVWATPVAGSADDAACSYSAGNHTVTVNVTPTDDFAPTLDRDAGGSIRVVDGDEATDICGGAVGTTDTIVINNASAAAPVYIMYVDLGLPFAPGFTNEPDTSDEIEFEVNFGPAGGTIGFYADPATLDVTLGLNQMNLNAGEGDGVDADVTLMGVSAVSLVAGNGMDRVIGSGGTGTPAEPFAIPMRVSGGFQGAPAGDDDVIVGGSADDELIGGSGIDVIDGGAGADFIEGEALTPTTPGNDTITGGPGPDNILAGGGDDVVSGGGGPDLIRGEDGVEVLDGGGGRDRVYGGTGSDVLKGSTGRDRLYGEAGKDRHNGGPGVDRCTGGPGPDTFKSCEKSFP